MASVKFSAFDLASDEFNSDLARLVQGFTHSLVKLISQEYARKEAEDDGTGFKKSSPLSSPKGKAPRKKATPKRGRPSKDETNVVIDEVNDIRSVSDELSSRVETVRSSSNSPLNEDVEPSIAVSLDDLINQPDVSEIVEEDTPPKKGKTAKKEKVDKEIADKEKREKKEKADREKKEKKEKADREKKEKKEKADREKKEKADREKKDPKAKKGKKDDPVQEQEPSKDPDPEANTLSACLGDDDDNDRIDTEVLASQTSETGQDDIDKLSSMMQSITIVGQLDGQLDEESNYANVIGTLEEVVTSSQNSQDDNIVIYGATPISTPRSTIEEEDDEDDEEVGQEDEL